MELFPLGIQYIWLNILSEEFEAACCCSLFPAMTMSVEKGNLSLNRYVDVLHLKQNSRAGHTMSSPCSVVVNIQFVIEKKS